MAVDGCGLVCKYIIIAFDCIFAVLGLALAGLGLWLRFSNSSRAIFEIEDLNSSAFVILVTAMIVLGAWMLIIVTFGEFGACSEHRCALHVFSGFVSILAGTVITAGVLVYKYSANVAQFFMEFYTTLYGLFKVTGDPVMGQALIFIHKMLHCCGVTGFRLEDIDAKTCPGPQEFWEHFVMNGCPSKIASVFDTKAPLMLAVFVGTGALLIVVLICSWILDKHLKRSQNEINAYYSKVY